MPVEKGKLSARADGKRPNPSDGPRAKAVGAKEIAKSNYPSRGTENPVR